jgi:uncharacterized protein YndB with AHSA1/START domain
MSSVRRIELEIEVPGTPEQVWQAIATGQGITAWFVPARVEEQVGGVIELDCGPRMGTAQGQVAVSQGRADLHASQVLRPVDA